MIDRWQFLPLVGRTKRTGVTGEDALYTYKKQYFVMKDGAPNYLEFFWLSEVMHHPS